MTNVFSDKTFLESYITAFEGGNGAEIARFYNAPCVTVRADGSVHSFTSEAEIEAFFGKAAATYAAEGMTRFSASDAATRPHGDQSVGMSCTWTMSRADGSVIRSWDQSYVIHKVGSDWKIITSVFHLSSS